MGWQTVELTEEEKQSGSGEYYKFKSIGEKLLAVFVSSSPSSGQYAKPGDVDYTLKTRGADGKVKEVKFTPRHNLAKQMAKAQLKPGYRVLITYTEDVDVGKESPMRVYSFQFDASPQAAKPPPPPPPSREPGDDDLPF
jgi:hypothetical protein